MANNPFPKEKITAVDFINEYVEFRWLVPSHKEWSKAKLAHHKPLLYRYKCLVALQKAFGISSRLVGMEKGLFLPEDCEDAPGGRYAVIFRTAIRITERAIGHKLTDTSRVGRRMRRTFCALLEFKMAFRRLQGMGGCVMEGSAMFFYEHWIKIECSGRMRKQLRSVDEALGLFISPEQRSFSEAQLVSDFGYPDDDLGWLEAEAEGL